MSPLPHSTARDACHLIEAARQRLPSDLVTLSFRSGDSVAWASPGTARLGPVRRYLRPLLAASQTIESEENGDVPAPVMA